MKEPEEALEIAETTRTDSHRVLVFPGGTEIGIEINRSLRFVWNIEIFSAGSAVSNHAPYVFKNHFNIPSIHEKDWIGRLKEVVCKNEIDFIYPAYDDVLLALMEHEDQLQARVVASPLETCKVTRFKSSTYRLLADIVPTPSIYRSADRVTEFPIFTKPNRGQGSEGTIKVDNESELKYVTTKFPDHLLTEYLPGDEYTVDCFTDRELGLLYVGGRRRIRTKNGISYASEHASDDLFLEYAKAISSRLEFHGAWFYQLKRDRNGSLKLLEVAPRIAGTMALHRVTGINFPLLSIYEQDRIPITINPNRFTVRIDRCLSNHYQHDLQYRSVYVDLDDTLVVKENVNTLLVRFLFQAINSGKQITLLTRAQDNFHERLKKLRIFELFDDIVQVKPGQEKAEFIGNPDSIFIDDSFRERMSVAEKTGIPTFDCSMVEMLIDEKGF